MLCGLVAQELNYDLKHASQIFARQTRASGARGET